MVFLEILVWFFLCFEVVLKVVLCIKFVFFLFLDIKEKLGGGRWLKGGVEGGGLEFGEGLWVGIKVVIFYYFVVLRKNFLDGLGCFGLKC